MKYIFIPIGLPRQVEDGEHYIDGDEHREDGKVEIKVWTGQKCSFQKHQVVKLTIEP